MFGNDWQSFVDDMIDSRKSSMYVKEFDQNLQKAGVIPRAINSVFKEHQQCKERFQLFCSFLQIYNQKIYDLLQDSPTPKPLNIHESKVNGIFVEGLTQFQVENLGDCLKLMRQGQKNRFVRETTMNAKSSRSHTIFQILVQATTSDSQGNYVKSRLNLCDLAGSQKIHKGENLKNEHLQQLKNINLSLTTLGKVINSLSSGKKATVAAFRESKLTRLLQQSLTINTNTFIIGNISPSLRNIDETMNTLKFTERASHITMKVKPIQFNEMNPDSVLKLKKEIQYLKNLLNLKKQGVNNDFEQQQVNMNSQSKNQKQEKGEILTQKQFEKLLVENRKMKKEIYELQNNLQKIKNQTSSMNSSRCRQNSAISAHNSAQSQISSHNSLRRQYYLQKFLKNGKESQNKRENRNRSVFVSAGKATIEHDKIDDHLVKIKSQQNRQQKLSILKRFQQMQNAKRLSEKLILQQLDNIKNQNQGNDNKQIQNNSRQNGSHRNYETNVFRRGKMSLQMGLVENNTYKEKNENKVSQKRKKIDYKEKIKQLQNRLFNK